MARYLNDEYIAPAVPVRTVQDEVVVTRDETYVTDEGPNLPWLIGIVLAACVVILIAALAYFALDEDEATVVPVNPNPSPSVVVVPQPAAPAPPPNQIDNSTTNNNFFPPAEPQSPAPSAAAS